MSLQADMGGSAGGARQSAVRIWVVERADLIAIKEDPVVLPFDLNFELVPLADRPRRLECEGFAIAAAVIAVDRPGLVDVLPVRRTEFVNLHLEPEIDGDESIIVVAHAFRVREPDEH